MMAGEFDFSNTTAQELLQLLAQRADEELAADADRFSAVLGAALLLVAEVLRDPIQRTEQPQQAAEELVAFSARWLRELLRPVAGERP
ncbi:MAG: hypothetical protein ACREUF_07420 [Solimonas sp.]